MTQRLNDAYAILTDPARRAEYDRVLRGRTSSSSGGTGQTSSRTTQNRPPPPPHRRPSPPRRPPPNPYEDYIAGLPKGFIYGAVAVVTLLVVVIIMAVSSGGSDDVVREVPTRIAPNQTVPDAGRQEADRLRDQIQKLEDEADRKERKFRGECIRAGGSAIKSGRDFKCYIPE